MLNECIDFWNQEHWIGETKYAIKEGLLIEEIKRDEVHSKFDITFNITEKENQLHWDIEYNISLYDHQTIEIMMEKIKLLTLSILANPQLSVSEYDIRLLFEREETIPELDLKFNF